MVIRKSSASVLSCTDRVGIGVSVSTASHSITLSSYNVKKDRPRAISLVNSGRSCVDLIDDVAIGGMGKEITSRFSW